MALGNPISRALLALLALSWLCAPASAEQADGVRAFDWEIGAWETVVRIRAPLSEDAGWTEFSGTSIVHSVSDGRANLVELSVANGDRRIEGVSLRLHSPQTGQWSLNFASMRDGQLTPPVYGGFEDGRGVFYGQDTVDGRVVLVRFVISDVSANSARFVQSYSSDGGQSWIENWIAVDTR